MLGGSAGIPSITHHTTLQAWICLVKNVHAIVFVIAGSLKPHYADYRCQWHHYCTAIGCSLFVPHSLVPTAAMHIVVHACHLICGCQVAAAGHRGLKNCGGMGAHEALLDFTAEQPGSQHSLQQEEAPPPLQNPDQVLRQGISRWVQHLLHFHVHSPTRLSNRIGVRQRSGGDHHLQQRQHANEQ